MSVSVVGGGLRHPPNQNNFLHGLGGGGTGSSGAMYQNPSLFLDFRQRGSLHSIITFVRASEATRFNSAGILQTVGSNVARFNHDSISGASLGLLIEESRTNNALWARDFTNVVWVETNITSAKDATGLDGVANSASTLTAGAANSTTLQTITLASSAYTFSVYVRRKTGSGNIDITDDNGTNWTTLTGLSSTGWTRHGITRTQANPVVGFRIVASGDEIEVDYAGLEGGSFRTSPITTTTAAATRVADVATITGRDFSSWFNTSEGMFIWEGSLDNDVTASVFRRLLQVDDDTGNSERITILATPSSNEVDAVIFSSGVNSLDVAGQAYTPGSPFKVALSYNTNNVVFSVDGSVESDAVVTLPSGLVALGLGGQAFNGGNPMSGHIYRIVYYPVGLSNPLSQAFTV